MLKVCEIFKTILGESSLAGYPFVIVRTTGCNLRCSWCDTRYAFYEGEEIPLHEVFDRIESFKIRRVLLTGGEPLIQKGSAELLSGLTEKNFLTAVETNGSLDIGVLGKDVHIIMDCKLPRSGMKDKMLALNYDKIKKTDDIKFVVACREDFNFAKNLIWERELENKANLFFSPVFGKVKFSDLAEWLLKSGLNARLQLQLHKLIWNEKERGV
ncbi:radical SAM protein [candidate division WOR-3 bacterium]|nr:radical SAM protein [candidate division WOR-3 bacterium]